MSQSASPAKDRYERRDVDPVALSLLVILLVISGVLVHLVVAGTYSVFLRTIARSSRAQVVTAGQFPEPRLQYSPSEDLQALRARENALLGSYGWVNQEAGVVRIPIDRAMDLLVQRGLPRTNGPVTPQDLQQKRPEQNPPRPSFLQEEAK